jgi:adenosine deaminase
MKKLYQSTEVPTSLEKHLKAMPKVEIHIHLEGATDAETIFEMSRRNKIPLPVDSLEEWKAYYEFRDFAHFIEVYIAASRCMLTPDDYVAMVESFLMRQAGQNIKYSEAYFSPSLHLGRKLTKREVYDALEAGVKSGSKKYGSTVRFIADISREVSHLQDKVLKFALDGRERDGLFIGLGVGGPEVGHPPEDFTETYAKARDAKLHVTAHAGEGDGAKSIWGALEALKIERIGHGTRCFEDSKLISHLQKTQTPLEVSPNSNYCLGIVKPTEPHPVRRMTDEGLYVTLNSDDPPMFSTDLNNEYLTLARQGFSWDELWQINLNTLNASFLPDSEKDAYRKTWQAFAAENLARL